MPQGTLFDSPKYRQFITDRDRALEQVHQNAQMDISKKLFESLEQIEGFVSRMALRDSLEVSNMNYLSTHLEAYLSQNFGGLFMYVIGRTKRMRKSVFILTYSAELEALSRATGKTADLGHHPNFAAKITNAEEAETLNGQLEKRTWYSLLKLRAKIIQAFNLGLVQELSPKELLEKVKAAFPKIETYKRPPRNIKPIREAAQDRPSKEIYQFNFINDSDWELAVNAYKDSELPPSRFDNVSTRDEDASYYKYNWEVEQELTDDFVKQVRDGQVDAASEIGIKEFVWVAIIDNKTDECCVKRNGHTTSEIEEMLSSGKLDADLCDASVPPAHPNCRCQLAPVASTDEVQGPDWKSFNDWVNS